VLGIASEKKDKGLIQAEASLSLKERTKAQRKRAAPDRRRILVITGTPGVGKTFISNLLASKLEAERISIGELVEKENLHIGWDEERKTLIADLERLSRRIKEIIRNRRKTLIFEGHYAVHVVPPEKVHLTFVLRRDPRKLEKTLKNRGYNPRKIRENLAAEILDVCLYDAVNMYGVEKVCEIDTSRKKPNEVVEMIILIMEGKKKCQVGLVDWLGMLENEGELDKYLEDF